MDVGTRIDDDDGDYFDDDLMMNMFDSSIKLVLHMLVSMRAHTHTHTRKESVLHVTFFTKL